jgi:DNA polymerase III epsilon subunit-like protein
MSTQATARAPRPLAFIDTETTGLDPRKHDAWEIAVIVRDAEYAAAGITRYDREHVWQIPVPLDTAEPKALEIGRYHERFRVPSDTEAIEVNADGTIYQRLLLPEFLFDLQEVLKDAVLIGSNPAFDDAFLKKLLQDNGRRIGWHYRTVDIATMAVGHLYGQAYTLTKQQCDPAFYGRADALLEGGWRSYELSRLMGIEPPSKADAHTALGDARWARDVYDAITKADAFYTATDDQLSVMAGQALSNGGQK